MGAVYQMISSEPVFVDAATHHAGSSAATPGVPGLKRYSSKSESPEPESASLTRDPAVIAIE